MKIEKSLTPKQRVFVQEYLIDLNSTKAAIRAGYSPKRADQIGHENLRKPEIKTAIQSAMAEREKRTEITQDYVLNIIKETINRCRQVEPVKQGGEHIRVETPDGQEVPAFIFDAKNVLKGCELLGKHLGMFKERLEVEGSVNSAVVHIFLPDNGRDGYNAGS